MESLKGALKRLTLKEYQVSAHYLITKSGLIKQLVGEDKRAWHSGTSYWGGITDINSRSIGIELDNSGATSYPSLQMLALLNLCKDIMVRWSIPNWRVLGHSDVSIGRKVDPGPIFDWFWLYCNGVGPWYETVDYYEEVDEAKFLKDATIFGYETSIGTSALLKAFRLHMNPKENGPLNAFDCACMSSLAKKYPVDLLKL